MATTIYDHDLKVAMITKSEDLPKENIIKGTVCFIDLVPTLLDLIDISTKGYYFDGISMLPVIEKNEARKEVYSKDLFETRNEVDLQSI